MAPSQEIIDAVFALFRAETWNEIQQIVEQQHALLLTDEAEQIIADLLDEFQCDEQFAPKLKRHRALLRRCREVGIDAAFAEMTRPQQPAQEIIEAVQAFVNARTVEEKKQVAEEQQETLLTDAADDLVAHNIEHYQGCELQRYLSGFLQRYLSMHANT